MKNLEYVIYIYFFMQIFRWFVSSIQYVFFMSDLQRCLVNPEIDIKDNIIWIAPTIYFMGGLS